MIDAHVTDRRALAARSPIELAMYLRARGWETRDRDDDSVQWVRLVAFTASVNRGISANLCEALVGLGGENGHSFELDLCLAASRPLPHRRPKPIRFRHDHLPVLEAAAQELRERVAEESVAVIGSVVRLHREGSGTGEISVSVRGDLVRRGTRIVLRDAGGFRILPESEDG
jgi:hypothetical protein